MLAGGEALASAGAEARRGSSWRVGSVAFLVMTLSVLAVPQAAAPAPRPSIAAYRGLGSWVDLFDSAQWDDPEGTVAAMQALGVRTLYLETSNHSRDYDLFRPQMTERFIVAAHLAGMRVVGWYLPGFANLRRDYRRSMAAINFETADGQAFDSFGLDIEARLVTDVEERNARVLRLSRRIREAAGTSYPLGAIIPAPRDLELFPNSWPGFPYLELGEIYDVFVPMGYFTNRTNGARGAHEYTRRNIEIIREETGRPSVPIHVAGGIASFASGPEVRAFVRAVREHGVLGASLYDYATSGTEDWPDLATVPVNPRQSPALPVPVGTMTPLGLLPAGDRTHPKEVFYRVGGSPGDWQVKFRVFDVQSGEVSLWLNWHLVKELGSTQDLAWSRRRTVDLPDEWLLDGQRNYIHFVAAGDYPDWSRWGVKEVTVVPGP
jgi:hypothetical protein